jgi:L-iditol 2-dehydrogenase
MGEILIPDTMLAAVYHGPKDIRLEQRPVPVVGPDEALLKVFNASICGTDLRILHGSHRMYPKGTIRIPGHELVGAVAVVGENVKGIVEVGKQVFVAPNMGCGHCRQCVSGHNNRCANYSAFGVTIDGAFAAYMHIPYAAIFQGNLIPIDKSVDPAVAALIEPFACVLRGQNAVATQAGDVVLVVGAGPIGIMHMLLARFQGASSVIVSELSAERAEQAKELGATRVVNPANEDLASIVAEETNGEGADVVLIAAPAYKAQEEALELAAIGGRINYFGGLPKDRSSIHFNSNLVHYKELVVTGTTACSTWDCQRAATIIGSGQIDLSPLISARFPLREIEKAFAVAEERKALKIVLDVGDGA